MGKIGSTFEPQAEGCCVCGECGMGYSLFDVCGSEDGERPEEISEVGVNEHGACHAADGEVGASIFCCRCDILRAGQYLVQWRRLRGFARSL